MGAREIHISTTITRRKRCCAPLTSPNNDHKKWNKNQEATSTGERRKKKDIGMKEIEEMKETVFKYTHNQKKREKREIKQELVLLLSFFFFERKPPNRKAENIKMVPHRLPILQQFSPPLSVNSQTTRSAQGQNNKRRWRQFRATRTFLLSK